MHPGIQDIPEDLDAFEQRDRDYEASHFRYAETNHRIGAATLEPLLDFYRPRSLYWAGRPVAHALMHPPLLTAMGFAPAPRWLRARILARLPSNSGKPHAPAVGRTAGRGGPLQWEALGEVERQQGGVVRFGGHR